MKSCDASHIVNLCKRYKRESGRYGVLLVLYCMCITRDNASNGLQSLSCTRVGILGKWSSSAKTRSQNMWLHNNLHYYLLQPVFTLIVISKLAGNCWAMWKWIFFFLNQLLLHTSHAYPQYFYLRSDKKLKKKRRQKIKMAYWHQEFFNPELWNFYYHTLLLHHGSWLIQKGPRQ